MQRRHVKSSNVAEHDSKVSAVSRGGSLHCSAGPAHEPEGATTQDEPKGEQDSEYEGDT
jgi:hypothetical protein